MLPALELQKEKLRLLFGAAFKKKSWEGRGIVEEELICGSHPNSKGARVKGLSVIMLMHYIMVRCHVRLSGTMGILQQALEVSVCCGCGCNSLLSLGLWKPHFEIPVRELWGLHVELFPCQSWLASCCFSHIGLSHPLRQSCWGVLWALFSWAGGGTNCIGQQSGHSIVPEAQTATSHLSTQCQTMF